MSNSNQPRIAVLFGGRSAEHEISVVSAHQVMGALLTAGFEILPVYITKSGKWLAGSKLNDLTLYRYSKFRPETVGGVLEVTLNVSASKGDLHSVPAWRFGRGRPMAIDVFFPVIHGTFGEDGTLQGLFELANVAFVGSDTMASAIGIDKQMSKRVASAVGVPVLPAVTVTRRGFEEDPTGCITEVEAVGSYPFMVKPVRMGSSIGVSRCESRDALSAALVLALRMDTRAIVEQALSDFIELNCAVQSMPARVSVCEQPTHSENFLSFDAKYRRGGKKKLSRAVQSEGLAASDRLIPAPVGEDVTVRVKGYARAVFNAIGAAGVARLDFLYHKSSDRLLFNEINTLPGSLAFYLWEADGISFEALVTSLVAEALDRHRLIQGTEFTMRGSLLARE